MYRALRFLGQAGVYLAVAAVLGYFSDSPAYTYLPPDRAVLRLALVHGGERKEKCHELSVVERAKLAPNMRKKVDCPRERVPLYIELTMDDGLLFRGSLPATGLAGDGPSKVYQRFTVVPGSHRFSVRMRDSRRTEGYDYEASRNVTLMPRQNLVIEFQKESGGFRIGEGAADAVAPR